MLFCFVLLNAGFKVVPRMIQLLFSIHGRWFCTAFKTPKAGSTRIQWPILRTVQDHI